MCYKQNMITIPVNVSYRIIGVLWGVGPDSSLDDKSNMNMLLINQQTKNTRVDNANRKNIFCSGSRTALTVTPTMLVGTERKLYLFWN